MPVATSEALAVVAADAGNWGANPSAKLEPTNADKAQSESFFMCVSSIYLVVGSEAGLVATTI